ncbi:23570_t:CDS:2, partial [Gigaspora margarita]
MEKVPYEVLDHSISSAILARDEVIQRNHELRSQGQSPIHTLHFIRKSKQQTISIRAHYCHKLPRFYLQLLHNKKLIQKIEAVDHINVAAIDPSVRTFLTWYSPTIGHGNFGNNDINRIFRLGLALDDLISHTYKAPAKKHEVYKKAALWLSHASDVIILPTFGSTRMSCQQERKLNSKTVRMM